MAAYAGPAPWYQGVSETYKNGRRKPRLVSGNQEWNLSEGWHVKRQAGWYKHPDKKKGQTVTKHQVTGPDGKRQTIYVSEGYDDYIGFHNKGVDKEALNYALEALDSKDTCSVTLPWNSIEDGHIKKFEYAPREQVMRVTFWNDAKVLYFRVPTALGGSLYRAAQDNRIVKHSRGQGRHLLGCLFWEYVRIKHQIHGSRYPFQYEAHGAYSFTGSNKRYNVKLTKENFELVTGESLNDQNARFKVGNIVNGPLSEEQYARMLEYKKLADEKKKIEAELAEHGTVTRKLERLGADGTGKGGEVSSVPAAEYNYMTDDERALLQKKLERVSAVLDRTGPLSPLEKEVLNGLEQNLKFGREKEHENMLSAREELYDVARSAYNERFPNVYNDQLLNNIEGRPGRPGITGRAMEYIGEDKPYIGISERPKSPRNYLDKDDLDLYRSLNKKKSAAVMARPYLHRTWTIDDLKYKAIPGMPGAVSTAKLPAYKAFIDSGDWQGALDFLKHPDNRYAGPQDELL